jgi:hypothetical protein
LGDAVHYACELDDLRTLDEDTVGADIVGYLRAWRKFKNGHNITMYGIETRLFHPIHRYCGTVDRIMYIAGRLTVLDIKTGEPWPSHGPQTAAYQQMVLAKTGFNADRICLYLREDGTYIPPNWQDNREDWGVFLSCLNVYNFKRRNNGN